VDDWAVELLEAARTGGGDVSSLALARSYWKLNRPAEARREFGAALQQDAAPAAYLKMCIAALDDPPALPQPTTAPIRPLPPAYQVER
jgi:hypothetical protein